jgi:CTP:molybdopterin cytidylyltransferase MocA
MALASAWLLDSGHDAARVWVHPVDLPRVCRRTLGQLARVAAAAPARPVRPLWGRQPGHPLVMPGRLLQRLAPAARRTAGSWRDFYECEVAAGRAPAVIEVPVADPGVVLDHDEPDAPAAPGRED